MIKNPPVIELKEFQAMKKRFEDLEDRLGESKYLELVFDFIKGLEVDRQLEMFILFCTKESQHGGRSEIDNLEDYVKEYYSTEEEEEELLRELDQVKKDYDQVEIEENRYLNAGY